MPVKPKPVSQKKSKSKSVKKKSVAASKSVSKLQTDKRKVITKLIKMEANFKTVLDDLLKVEKENTPLIHHNPKEFFEESSKFIKLSMYNTRALNKAIRFSNVLKKYPDYLGITLVYAYRKNIATLFLAAYQMISSIYKTHMNQYRICIAFLVMSTKETNNLIYKICRPLITHFFSLKTDYDAEDALLSIFEDNKLYKDSYVYLPINREHFIRTHSNHYDIYEYATENDELIDTILKNKPGIEYLGLCVSELKRLKKEIDEEDARSTGYDSYYGF